MKTCLLLVLSCLLTAVGCDDAPSTPAAAPGAVSNVTLQLNWKAEPQFGGFYAAQVNGAYAKNGLNVEVKEGGAGAPTIDMLAAGTVPYAVVSGDELLVARSRGKKIVALFAVYQTHPQGIMTRASRGMKVIGDIFKTEGTLAMQKGLPYSDFLQKKYGFDKLQIAPSPFGDLSVFRTQENYAMQCFVTSEPLAAKKLGIEPSTFLIADAGYNPYATVLATSESHLAANRDQVRAMVAAVRDGWAAYLNDPAAANAAMANINKTMDAQTFIDSAAAQVPLIQTGETRELGLGCMTKERWRTLADQLVDLKVLETAPNVAECFVAP